MARLIKWEIKKIFKSKVVFIILLFLLFLTVNVYLFQGLREKETAENGEIITGIEAVEYRRSKNKEIFNGTITTESVKQDLQYFLDHYDREKNADGNDLSLGFDKRTYEEYILPREKYLRWAAQNYSNPNSVDSFFALEALTQEQLESFGDFYRQTAHQREKYMEDYPYGRLNDREKDYWSSLSSSIKTPYVQGYYEYASDAVDQVFVFIVVLAGLLLCISPIYTREYENKMDRILLTSKNGRKKLGRAKTITAYLFILIFLTLYIIIGLGSHYLVYGLEGMELPLQLSNTIIAYPWTYGQALAINIAVIYAIALGCTALVLFISSKTKKLRIPIIFVLLLLIGSIMIFPGINEILDKLIYLFPLRITGSAYQIYQSYDIFGKVLNIYEMGMLVYTLLFISFTPLALKEFKNHKIS